MKALTVEWGNENWIYHYDRYANGEVCIPIVRLAEVDAVLQEAVGMAEAVVAHTEIGVAAYNIAKAFLASPLVKAWEKRQKKEGGA